MALAPGHRELLTQFFESLKESTSVVVQEEREERSSLFTRAQRSPDEFDTHSQCIEEDIDVLMSALILLGVQQASLKRQRARAHNKRQLICNLPDEVLTHIFEVGIPAPSEQWLRDPYERPETQWTLDQYQKTLWSVAGVCGRFRVVVLNSPNCWAYVSYLSEACGPFRADMRLEALDTKLARSKGVLFNLHLEIRTRGTRPTAPSLEAFSRTVLPHMHRCIWFCLKCDDRGADLPLMADAEHPLCSLRYVAFNWYDDRLENSEEENLDRKAGESILSLLAGIQLPLLSLTINNGHIHQSRQSLDVKFNLIGVSTLTRLRIDAQCHIEHAIALLSSCSSLEHLYWAPQEVPGDPGLTNPLIRPVPLHSLISLYADCSFPRCVVLDAPHLEQIIWEYGLSLDILHPDQPSFPSLRRFSISEYHSSDSRLASFMRRHPHIIEVEIVPQNTYDFSPLNASIESLVDCSAQDVPSVDLRLLSLDTSWLVCPHIIGSVEHLMRKAVYLQLQLRLQLFTRLPEQNPGYEKVQRCIEEFASRIEVNPPKRLSYMWRDAWGRPGRWGEPQAGYF